MADWLVRLMDKAEVASAAIAGHSMGAFAALDCAARHPARVRALALLGAAPRMPVNPDLLAAAKADDHLAFELVTDWGHGRAGHLGGNVAPGLWVLGGGERLLERARPGVLYGDLQACDGYRDGLERAAKVACPCVLVLGLEDRMTPARAGRKLADGIPGARVIEIPGAGHMMMTEKPDETLDALRTAF
jgi:pimeloyl-ACP methyl ester carboxylesterase